LALGHIETQIDHLGQNWVAWKQEHLAWASLANKAELVADFSAADNVSPAENSRALLEHIVEEAIADANHASEPPICMLHHP